MDFVVSNLAEKLYFDEITYAEIQKPMMNWIKVELDRRILEKKEVKQSTSLTTEERQKIISSVIEEASHKFGELESEAFVHENEIEDNYLRQCDPRMILFETEGRFELHKHKSHFDPRKRSVLAEGILISKDGSKRKLQTPEFFFNLCLPRGFRAYKQITGNVDVKTSKENSGEKIQVKTILDDGARYVLIRKAFDAAKE